MKLSERGAPRRGRTPRWRNDADRRPGVMRRAYSSLSTTRPARFVSRHVSWKLDILLLRLSRGRLSTTLLFPAAVLETTGARSGERRLNAVIYARDGGSFVILASNAGSARHPAWFHNLRRHPAVVFNGVPMLASVVAEGNERERLWAAMVRVFPAFERFGQEASEAGRTVPVVRLTPVNASGSE